MIRRLRSLCAKILSRIVPATEVQGKQFGATPLVHRRVVVTVERETISDPGARPTWCKQDGLWKGRACSAVPGLAAAGTVNGYAVCGNQVQKSSRNRGPEVR